MEFKIVPFTAQVNQNDKTSVVAGQMQTAIDAGNSEFFDTESMDKICKSDREALLKRIHAEYPEYAPYISLKRSEYTANYRNEDYTSYCEIMLFKY